VEEKEPRSKTETEEQQQQSAKNVTSQTAIAKVSNNN